MKKLCALVLFGSFFVFLASAHAGPVEHIIFPYDFTIYSQGICLDENEDIEVTNTVWHLSIDARGPNNPGKRGHCKIHLNLQDYTAVGTDSGTPWLVQIAANAVHNWTVDHNDQQVGTITLEALLINLDYCQVVKFDFTFHITILPDGEVLPIICEPNLECCTAEIPD